MKLPPDLAAKCLALAGESAVSPARARRKPREVLTGDRPRWSVTLTPACRVVTEANTHEHWATADRRRKAQKIAVRAAWQGTPLARDWSRCLPVVVTLTHTGPQMDTDNLARAFKAVRDEVARLIGVDDGDGRVEWVYEQEPGKPAVKIRIESV